MTSISYGGLLHMKPVEENVQSNSICGYPLEIPKIILDGYVDECLYNLAYSSEKESIVSIRDKRIVMYTDHTLDLMGNQKFEIAEFDFEKMCKRTYDVVLNKESPIDKNGFRDISYDLYKEVFEERLKEPENT